MTLAVDQKEIQERIERLNRRIARLRRRLSPALAAASSTPTLDNSPGSSKDKGAEFGAAANFHFVVDYGNLVSNLKKRHDLDTAMSAAVGGHWEEFGQKLSKLAQSVGLKSGMRLLDFGCGSGRLAYFLSRELELEGYVGIDIVDDLLQYARDKCPKDYQFIKSHSLNIPVESQFFDFACGFSIFTHLLQAEILLYTREIFRALKPGGIFVYSFLEMENNWQVFESTCIEHRRFGKPYPHLNMFLDRNQVKIMAEKSGFKVLKFVEPRGGVGQTVAVLSKPLI